MPTKPATSWRDCLKIHPAAELFPRMTPDELKILAEDIAKTGVQIPITVMSERVGEAGEWSYQLLDGRNRLDAIELAGFNTIAAKRSRRNVKAGMDCGLNPLLGIPDAEVGAINYIDAPDNPYAYVISANIHRRHLTAEQKQKVLIDLVAAQPGKSDRELAKQAGVSHPSIAKARRKAEATGNALPVERAVGADGKSRKQPSRKPSKPKQAKEQEKAVAPPPQPSNEAPQAAAESPVSPAPPPPPPAPPPRDDIGPDSQAEAARLQICVETLQAEKCRLELKISGLERDVENLKAKLQARQGPPADESPEGYWQRSLTGLADEVIVRTTLHWPDNWKTFGVPPDLLEHAMKAMTTWCDLVKQL